jgi:hypothetical protein
MHSRPTAPDVETLCRDFAIESRSAESREALNLADADQPLDEQF